MWQVCFTCTGSFPAAGHRVSAYFQMFRPVADVLLLPAAAVVLACYQTSTNISKHAIADTFVGGPMLRGISGGQKKRY